MSKAPSRFVNPLSSAPELPSDEAMNRIADKMGAAAKVYPLPLPASAAPVETTAEASPVEATAQPVPDTNPAPAVTPGRRTLRRVTVEVPEYLFDALRDKAHVERCTITAVLLRSLRTAGFAIEAADIQDDARRNNGKRKA